MLYVTKEIRPIYEPDADQQLAWMVWLGQRPESVMRVAERLPPWLLYRLKSTGQLVEMRSFSEDGTVTVAVLKQWNGPHVFERDVFGVDPADLEAVDAEPSEWRGR